MDTNLLEKITKEYKKVKHPDFKVGDIIEVHTRIVEEKKERIQVFKGIVIAIKGAGISKTFKVRKISYGVGVEKTFPLYSPMIAKIRIIKQGKKVRRSKLYFLRKRVGKTALKAGMQIPAEGENLETRFEEESEKKEEKKGDEDDKKEGSVKDDEKAKKQDKEESKVIKKSDDSKSDN